MTTLLRERLLKNYSHLMGLCTALIVLSTQSTLHIGLFFAAVQEMISIMQDYGEVCVLCGKFI